MKFKISNQTKRVGFRTYDKWLEEVGVSRTTGWRWRSRGWIKTTNVSGRVYVADDEILCFMRRVEAGDFAKIASISKYDTKAQKEGKQ